MRDRDDGCWFESAIVLVNAMWSISVCFKKNGSVCFSMVVHVVKDKSVLMRVSFLVLSIILRGIVFFLLRLQSRN
jgi:hypothetical protein